MASIVHIRRAKYVADLCSITMSRAEDFEDETGGEVQEGVPAPMLCRSCADFPSSSLHEPLLTCRSTTFTSGLALHGRA